MGQQLQSVTDVDDGKLVKIQRDISKVEQQFGKDSAIVQSELKRQHNAARRKAIKVVGVKDTLVNNVTSGSVERFTKIKGETTKGSTKIIKVLVKQ